MYAPTEKVHTPTYWRRGMATNATATSYPSLAPTATAPATVNGTAVVFDCGKEAAHLMFFGADSNNDTFQAKVVGWRVVRPGPTQTGAELWVPTRIGTFNCTLSDTCKGLAGGMLTATEFVADTIVEENNTFIDDLIKVWSPADDTAAMIAVRTPGFQKLGVYFDIDAGGGTPGTAGNVLWTLGGW